MKYKIYIGHVDSKPHSFDDYEVIVVFDESHCQVLKHTWNPKFYSECKGKKLPLDTVGKLFTSKDISL